MFWLVAVGVTLSHLVTISVRNRQQLHKKKSLFFSSKSQSRQFNMDELFRCLFDAINEIILWSLISCLYNFKVLGMNIAAQAVSKEGREMISLLDGQLMGPERRDLESDTTSIQMESFEPEFESEKELYSREDCKITLVMSSERREPVVVKECWKNGEKKSQNFHQIHEIEFSKKLQSLPQKHLISIYDINPTSEKTRVEMEYACGGNLTQYVPSTANFITKYHKLNHLKTVKSILWNVLQGIEQIHQLGYIHRDIKPDNILITHSGQIKICDFQLVGEIGTLDDSICGTPEYMPPERLTEKRINCTLDASVDMWALGILAFELLTGYVPYSLDEDNIDGLVDSMYEGYAHLDEDYPSYCRHLIFNLLQTNPRKRMTIEKVKKHPFFTTDFHLQDKIASTCLCLKRE